MPSVFDWLTDFVLMMMSLLGIIRVQRLQDAISVFGAMIGVSTEELYLAVELYIENHWTGELSAFDVHRQGKEYFVGKAAANEPNPLLLEAMCRLRGVQLTIWDLEHHSCEIFGHHGPMHNAAILDGSFVALIGTPVLPWYEKVFHELDPSTSYGNEPQHQIDHFEPMEMAPGDVILVRRRSVEVQVEMEQEDQLIEDPQQNSPTAAHDEAPTEDEAAAAVEEFEPEEDEAAGPQIQPQPTPAEENNEDQPRPASQHRQAESPEHRHQPVFRPADITGLPPHMVAELVTPQRAPYEIENGKIVCRLAHCEVPDREFNSISAWKKHVALARCHLKDVFCALCGHFLIVPDGLEPDQIKEFIKAHKAERCLGASKTIMKKRRIEAARLETLMRTASQILLPDEDERAQQPVQEAEDQPAGRRKRAYPTEEARRADICTWYIKKFKCDHPETMAEIAEQYQLQIL